MRRAGGPHFFTVPQTVSNTPVWDDGPWLGFPQLTDRVTADLCVVGLGGSGLRAASEGVRKGMSVVGLDAGQVASGASGRNGGFLLAGMALFYHEARERYGPDRARSFYEETVIELGEFYDEGARQTGSLRIGIDDGELTDIEAEFAALREDGHDVEWYEGPEGAGILIPVNGVCNPMHRVRDLACATADIGARLFENSPAVAIEPNLVKSHMGDVEAEHILVAVDGGLETLLPSLASRVHTASLQMVATAPDPGLTLTRPVYTNYGYEYYQQLPDGSVALGGGRNQHPDLSWTTEPVIIPEIQGVLDDVLDRIGVKAPVTHRWSGRAAWTDDARPIMEELSPGVVVIGAYSGHGSVVGSLYARKAVEQMHAGRPISGPL